MIPITCVTPNNPAYPAQLPRYLAASAPARLTLRGNPALWHQPGQPQIALFCSGRVPAGILLALHDWAQANRRAGFTLISGFQSPAEQEAFTVLLGGQISLIYCPAREVETIRLKPAWRQAMEADRLLLLSPFSGSVRRGTTQTAHYRNRVIAALADKIIVAHAVPGGKTGALVQEALGWGKSVFTFTHPANSHLLAGGVGQLKDTHENIYGEITQPVVQGF